VITVRGGLRRPYGPFQVVCVLVAVALAAAFSSNSTVGAESRQPIVDKPHLGSAGARLNINKIAVTSGNPSANYNYLSVAPALSDVHGRRL
jgi:hypothetical protein